MGTHNNGERILKPLNLNVEAILLKGDYDPDVLTMQSSLRGTGFAIDRNGGIVVLDRHGFFCRKLEDMRIIHEELAYVIEEAERWRNA